MTSRTVCKYIESHLFKYTSGQPVVCEICLAATCPFKATVLEVVRRIWEGIFHLFITYCDCVISCGQGKMKDPACIFSPTFIHYTENLARLVIFSWVPLSWPFKLLNAWDQSLWFWNTLLYPSILPGERVENNWRGLIQTSQTDVGERYNPTQSCSDWNLSCAYHRWPFPFVKHVNLLF